MHAEIIATGSELLLGEVVDTNSTYLARQLRDMGPATFEHGFGGHAALVA